MLHWLHHDDPARDPFPPPAAALAEPNGLLAAGGGLGAERLIAAYRAGIFPWFGRGDPVLWWSPDPRWVVEPGAVKISRSLRKTLRRGGFEVTADRAFGDVMRACAASRGDDGGTWIGEEMIAAYGALHARGLAHSIETWVDGELAGGLYGVALGRAFFGESMFSRRSDTSKIALAHLARQLARWEFGLIDCQVHTPHLASLGAQPLPRTDFVRRLAELVNYPQRPGPWRLDGDLSDGLR